MADGGTGNLPVIALDAMGGDRAPEEIVAGAVRARWPSWTWRSCSRARRTCLHRSCRTVAAGHHRAARGRKSSRWATSPRTRCAPRRTPRSCVAPRPCATGGPAAMVGAGQHRRDDGRRAAALWAASKAWPGPRSRCRCRCPGVSAGASSSTRARPSIRNRRGWCNGRGSGASTPPCGSASTHPTIGLLSNGEEAGKGDDLRKQAGALLADEKGFIGNVEGRDLLSGVADVVVTDGFTGNIALKTLEGAMLGIAGLVFSRRGRARVGVGRRRLEAAAPRSRRAAAPGQHRRRGAARRERHLRDLARFVVGGCDRERDPGRA